MTTKTVVKQNNNQKGCIRRPKPQYDEIHLEYYDKKEMDRYLNYLENRHHHLHMIDTKTDKIWDVDFLFVAFPGLKHSGYRMEGFHQTGTTNGYPKGEMIEFGTLILKNKEMKIIQW